MTTNDNAFVRGIRRAVAQRMQREQQAAAITDAITVDSPVDSSEQCSVNAEQHRINLVNTILKHMRKHKEPTQ